MTDTITKCKFCGLDFENRVYSWQGVEKIIPCPVCSCEKKEKERIEKWVEHHKQLERRYKRAGFSRKLRGYRLRRNKCEHTAEAIKYVDNFKPFKSGGLFLIGSPGNGKTTLATCIGKELIKAGRNVIMKTFNDYLGEMQRAEFSKDYKDKYWQLEQWIKYNDLVIIDDFGREKYTENRLVNAFTFFDGLVSNCTSFIITANPESIARIKDLPEFSAVFDRIAGDCNKLIFKNASFRRNKC
jgi:DNA replication protein DnaC